MNARSLFHFTWVFFACNSFALASTEGQSKNQLTGTDIEKVVVYGREQNIIGEATSANEGIIGGADLMNRPLLKVAELLEGMPGMVAVQHSGSGKANQYFLRGFNLDHGTDYSVTIDDIPMNLPSHGHGQGYLDINGLIAETVDSMKYQKGPYYATSGDFSLAGNAAISTIDYLSAPFVSFEAGSYGWNRLAGGGSKNFKDSTLTAIAEVKVYDGPWEKPEALEHKAAWLKYVGTTNLGDFDISLSGYKSHWDPTEQIPERVIGSPVCEDEFCMLDSTSTGTTERWISNARLYGENWNASVFAQYYDWSMSSDPTYDYQINQFDRRVSLGMSGHYTVRDDGTLLINVGANSRLDNITAVGLEHLVSGNFIETLSHNSIHQISFSLYTDAEMRLLKNLRILGGLRQDFYQADITGYTNNSAQGNASDNLLQPKMGLAWAPIDEAEIYVNWGKGFHSNDARGAVADVPFLSPGYGREIGTRYNSGPFNINLAYWWLSQDSELIFVGDSNSVEPKGGSQRSGYEVSAFWRPTHSLAIDATFASSKARYKNADDGLFVENAIEQAGQLGISYLHSNLEINARLRYLGPYALTTDNQHRTNSLTTMNFRVSYSMDDIMLYGEIINALNTDGKEISYYYPAYIAGFDNSVTSSDEIDCNVINCVMSRATTPRSFRLGIRYNF